MCHPKKERSGFSTKLAPRVRPILPVKPLKPCHQRGKPCQKRQKSTKTVPSPFWSVQIKIQKRNNRARLVLYIYNKYNNIIYIERNTKRADTVITDILTPVRIFSERPESPRRIKFFFLTRAYVCKWLCQQKGVISVSEKEIKRCSVLTGLGLQSIVATCLAHKSIIASVSDTLVMFETRKPRSADTKSGGCRHGNFVNN